MLEGFGLIIKLPRIKRTEPFIFGYMWYMYMNIFICPALPINVIGGRVCGSSFLFIRMWFSGYSLIYNPWLCLIFEALESVTSSLSFTAAVTYAARLSSTTTDTSVQGLLGGLYYGVGKNFKVLQTNVLYPTSFLLRPYGVNNDLKLSYIVPCITFWYAIKVLSVITLQHSTFGQFIRFALLWKRL